MSRTHYIAYAACSTFAALTALATMSVPETEPAHLFHWEVQTCPAGAGFGGGCDLPSCTIRVLPHAGQGILEQTLQSLADAGEPLGVFVKDNGAPLGGDNLFEENVIPVLESTGLSLDYVLGDIEHHDSGFPPQADIIELVRQVRAHDKSEDAWIGFYGIAPGFPADYASYPFRADSDGQCNRHTLYTESSVAGGLNTAMPSCYIFEDYATYHAPGGYWDDFNEEFCPTSAAALLWAPLERASLSKRFMPAGDHLVPFVSSYRALGPSDPRDPDVTYPDPALLPAMQVALVRHMRLRGAEGLHMWETGDDPDDIRQTFVDTWCELDPYLANPNDEPCILNLATNKTGGIEWSGIVVDGSALFQISNMTDAAIDFTLPVVEETVTIPALSHHFDVYELQDPHVCVPQPVYALEPCLDLVECQQADVNSDGVVDSADIAAVAFARNLDTAVCAGEGDPHDVDRDGIIDGSDVIQVWLNEGVCTGSGPTGACCMPDASCLTTSAEDCAAASGNFFADEVCGGFSCGACCRVGVGCVVTTAAACQAIMENDFREGDFHAGQTCATACVGACCLTGDCEVMTCEQCFLDGGIYAGVGTTCGPETCGSGVIPCRTVDISGNGEVDFADALRVLGAWGNPGGLEDIDESGEVDFNDLLIVLTHWGCFWGACCLPDETCVIVDELDDCQALGGELQEGVITCDGDPCPARGRTSRRRLLMLSPTAE